MSDQNWSASERLRAGKPGHFGRLLGAAADLSRTLAGVETGPENPDATLSTGVKVIPRTSRTPSTRFTDTTAALSGRLAPGVRTESRVTCWFQMTFWQRKSWTI